MINPEGFCDEKTIIKNALTNTKDILNILRKVDDENQDYLKRAYLLGYEIGINLKNLSSIYIDLLNPLFYLSYSNEDLVKGYTYFISSINNLIIKAEEKNKKSTFKGFTFFENVVNSLAIKAEERNIEALIKIKSAYEEFLSMLTNTKLDRYLLSCINSGCAVSCLGSILISPEEYNSKLNEEYPNGLIESLNKDFKDTLETYKNLLKTFK